MLKNAADTIVLSAALPLKHQQAPVASVQPSCTLGTVLVPFVLARTISDGDVAAGKFLIHAFLICMLNILFDH